MIYMKWLVFALSEKLMDIINYLTAPFVVLFADQDGWLPKWLSWYQTPDNSLDGDPPWQAGRRPFADNTGWRRYINRVAWLYRNSMYGYANTVVGFSKDEPGLLVRYFDGPEGSGKPKGYENTGGPLLKWKVIHKGRVKAFQWFWIRPWGNGRCLRLNIGWKLWDWCNPKWKSCNCVLSINPWKKMEEQK